MMVRFVLVAYCVGAMLGVIGLIEWLVSRIARVWLSFVAAGLLSCAAAALASLVARIGRRMAR